MVAARGTYDGCMRQGMGLGGQLCEEGHLQATPTGAARLCPRPSNSMLAARLVLHANMSWRAPGRCPGLHLPVVASSASIRSASADMVCACVQA